MRVLVIGAVMAAVLAAMLFPLASPAQAATNCTQYYTVKWGDTLSGIGRWFGVPYTELAKWNNIANPSKIYAGQVLCVRKGTTSGTTTPVSYYYPTFSIVSVVRNSTVTVKTNNLPANDTFNVCMNYMGTRGVCGWLVATINSGAGGTQTLTFNIPDALKGQGKIAIRMQSPYSGYFAYNWFWNNTTP
jgi:hypothetical protein